MGELYRDSRTFFGIEDDTWIALAIWAIISYAGILGSVNRVVNLFVEETTVWDSLVVTLIWSVFILFGTFAAIKRMERRIFLISVAVALLWLVSYLVNENARLILKMYYFFPVIVNGICGMICIGHFKNWERFFKIGAIFITVGIILFFISGYLDISQETAESYMPFSYNNLIFVIGAYWLAINRKNILMWILAPMATALLVVVGCRGALVCVASYVLLEFIFNNKIHFLLKILFFVMIVLFLTNLEKVMLQIDFWLSDFDYESRTISMFMEGIIEDDSGRNRLYANAWEVVKKNLVFGCGMGGSSYHLFMEIYELEPGILERTYSHNLFLDLMMEYGIFFGTGIGGWIVYSIISGYFKNLKNDNISIIFLFIASSFTKLLLSSTYLAEASFFMFLALLINMNCYNEYAPWEKYKGEKYDVRTKISD